MQAPAQLPQSRQNHQPEGRVATSLRHLAAPTLWIGFGPSTPGGVHNFTPGLIGELDSTIDQICQPQPPVARLHPDSPAYAVIQSRDPDYFSQGGDLAFFLDCIQRRDAQQLHRYSMSCLDLLIRWTAQLKETTTTISLVQGRALGGGFEMTLASDYIVAEEQSTFGFPEIMFGLFPTTGAMGLISARANPFVAERMMTNKKIYTANELLGMGLVDEVCPSGTGELAVERYIANHAKRRKARLKIQQSRHRHARIDYEEGSRIVQDWVETAMALDADEIRQLELLILMQESTVATPVPDPSLKVA